MRVTSTVDARTKPRSFWFRLTCLLVAIVVVGVAISVMVSAGLGVAPADVLATGGANHFGIGVGTMGWIDGFIFTALAIAFRRPPSLGTLLGTILVGQTVNLVLPRTPHPDVIGVRLLMLMIGLTLLYAAITLGVATTLGTGPIELLMLGLQDAGLSMQMARWGIEAVIVLAGVLLGGQIGVGTLLFVLLTGPILARTLPPMVRFMGTEVLTPPAALDA